ncbi:hypothetical protein P3S68_021548 [Capsicum galapagoense]
MFNPLTNELELGFCYDFDGWVVVIGVLFDMGVGDFLDFYCCLMGLVNQTHALMELKGFFSPVFPFVYCCCKFWVRCCFIIYFGFCLVSSIIVTAVLTKLYTDCALPDEIGLVLCLCSCFVALLLPGHQPCVLTDVH